MNKDMLHQVHALCQADIAGTFEETSIYDDWDGIIHCTKCGAAQKRWVDEISHQGREEDSCSIR